MKMENNITKEEQFITNFLRSKLMEFVEFRINQINKFLITNIDIDDHNRIKQIIENMQFTFVYTDIDIICSNYVDINEINKLILMEINYEQKLCKADMELQYIYELLKNTTTK